MSITLNNGVINQRGTPSIITDVFANRPLATELQTGTLFFSSDTNTIYQVYLVGTVHTWETMGAGGGGGSQDLNSVLSNGSYLLDSYTIESDDSINLNFAGFNSVGFSGLYNFSVSFVNNWNLFIDGTSGLKMTSTELSFIGAYSVSNGFKIDIATDYLNNLYAGNVYLGDYAKILYGTYLDILPESLFIHGGTGENAKIYFRYDQVLDIGIDRDTTAYNLITLGDWDNNQVILQVGQGRVYTCSYAEIGTFGIDFDMTNSLARFGAGFGNYSGNFETYMQIEANNGYLTFNGLEQLSITGSANITTTSSGTSSSQHLKLNVNGISYLIPLRTA